MGFETQKISNGDEVLHEQIAETEKKVQPIWLSPKTINRLTSAGSDWNRLKLINRCAEVLRKLPEDKSGIVVGSGDKSDLWRSRGWKTLDSDPDSGADIIANANQELADPETQDYIFAECVSMGKDVEASVVPKVFLMRAFKALKAEGVLMIDTSSFDKSRERAIPNREDFTNLMIESGFNVVMAVLGKIVGKEDKHQKIFYYAVKTAKENAQTEKVNFDLDGFPIIKR